MQVKITQVCACRQVDNKQNRQWPYSESGVRDTDAVKAIQGGMGWGRFHFLTHLRITPPHCFLKITHSRRAQGGRRGSPLQQMSSYRPLCWLSKTALSLLPSRNQRDFCCSNTKRKRREVSSSQKSKQPRPIAPDDIFKNNPWGRPYVRILRILFLNA